LEFNEKLEMPTPVRSYVAGPGSDARLGEDRLVVASIDKAVHPSNIESFTKSGPWDVIVVDEAHHLSVWELNGRVQRTRRYKLVKALADGLPADGRLILMSGTPHQGNQGHFESILELLQTEGETAADVEGRVIFRTKDGIRDWNGRKLFPGRDVREPVEVELGEEYMEWYYDVDRLYETAAPGSSEELASARAKSTALQWAASSVEAGLGFLARMGIRRLEWTTDDPPLARALTALRPYRGGAADEDVHHLYARIKRYLSQNYRPQSEEEVPDDGEQDAGEDTWVPDPDKLAALLDRGVELMASPASKAKWDAVKAILDAGGGEKVVLFATPLETVHLAVRLIEEWYGEKAAMIVGDQKKVLTPA
jgi:hypothetical protein